MAQQIAKRWLITGVSSGLGKALMAAVIAHGDTVVGTVRTMPDHDPWAGEGPGSGRLIRMDVTDAGSIAQGADAALAAMGGVDVVVNNAGSGMFGPVEVCSLDDFRHAFEVNYFGLVAVTQAMLPHLRQSRGTLMNIASMSAIMTMGGTAPYAASKHAVLGVTEALREEMAPLGVKVVAVLPGGFRTDFWDARSNTIRDGLAEVYGAWPCGQIRAQSAQHVGNEIGDPAKFSALLIEVAGRDDAPLYLVPGADALDYVGAKRDAIATELAGWADRGRSTAFDG